MNTNAKIEIYTASTGRRYKIEQAPTISVRKVLEEDELDCTVDFEPLIGVQPTARDQVRFREPIPKDLIFRCSFLARKIKNPDSYAL